MTKVIAELKQLRADIDVLIGMGGEIKSSRETATAFTKLQEGRMHIGNSIFELGAFPIYKESKNPTNDKIDPYHVDELTPMARPADWSAGASKEITNVKIMRRELDGVIDRVRKVDVFAQLPEEEVTDADMEMALYASSFRHEAHIKLREAQNWYGMELGRIRDENG